MLNKRRIMVAVAMSGGVDSSVTAALCVEEYGKENVFGVTLKLFCYAADEAIKSSEATPDKSCCSQGAINDAKVVCDKLGIPHYVIDAEKDFKKLVIDDFVLSYQSAKTPNPCVRCNQYIKFDLLLKKVEELGARFLATGHYVRVNREGPKPKCGCNNLSPIFRTQLLRGVDAKKDQTYFLYNLSQEELPRLLFPVGELTKMEVRQIAQKFKLKVADKVESQEICFVPEGSVKDYLRPLVNFEPGDITDKSGNVLGRHEGLPFYTIGQRKGLGGGFESPMYVVGLDKKKNQVMVGPEADLYSSHLSAQDINWTSGISPKLPLKCTAKIRYNMEDAECVISLGNSKKSAPGTDHCSVTFMKPQKSVTRGQSIVFYDGEICLGGGIIK